MRRQISLDLRDRVLARFGLAGVPDVSATGLEAVYQAWCRHVPFDNVRKLIALHGGGPVGPLPTMDAVDFLETWLRHGVGGTCWPSSNALHALLDACGFEVRQVAASMFDLGEPSHAVAIATVDGAEWAVDTSMHTDRPVPLDRHETTQLDHPVFGTRAEPVEEGWLFTFSMANSLETMPCRTLAPDDVPVSFCAERYEVSRTWSPFNTMLSARRNDALGLVSHSMGSRHRRTAAGLESVPCEGDDQRADLIDTFGMSEDIVDALDAALRPTP